MVRFFFLFCNENSSIKLLVLLWTNNIAVEYPRILKINFFCTFRINFQSQFTNGHLRLKFSRSLSSLLTNYSKLFKIVQIFDEFCWNCLLFEQFEIDYSTQSLVMIKKTLTSTKPQNLRHWPIRNSLRVLPYFFPLNFPTLHGKKVDFFPLENSLSITNHYHKHFTFCRSCFFFQMKISIFHF